MPETCTTSPRNRLIGMESRTNLPAAVPRLKLSFAYDYMSRRVGKTVFSNDSGSWILTSDSSFLYDGWSMIRESKVQGLTSNVSHYVYGLDLSGTLQGAGTIGGILSRSEVSGLTSNVCFYAYDANGNVGQLLATNGASLAQYEYDPYGNIAQQSGSEASANPFRFSTKYLDQETGLYYYGLRFYSPGLGRWISRDPIGELAFTRVMSLMRRAMLTEIGPRHLMSGNPFTFNISILNDYAFVGNDGVNHEDLLGLTPVQRHPTTGVVYCNDKCEMVIKNCETWGAAEPCCKEHEQVHIDQFKKAGLWCKKVDGCCVGGGRTGNTGDLDPTRDQKKVQEEAECPAHKASLECCTKGMNKPGITEQEYWDYRDCAFRSYWQRKGYKCPGNENDGELPPPRTF